MKGLRISAFVLLGLLLFGCSPEKRLNKLQKKHGDLFKTVTVTDTIIIHDTLEVAADEQGKVFEWKELKPKTFVLENERSKTRVSVIPPTASEAGRVLVNTITKVVRVPIVKEVIVERKVKVPISKTVVPRWAKRLVWFNLIFFLLFGLIVWYLIKKGKGAFNIMSRY